MPTLVANVVAGSLTVDESDLATNDTANFANFFAANYGADGAGSVGNFVLGINPGDTGLTDTATGQAIILSMNGNIVEGKTAISGDLVFTISVDGSGTVTLDQIRAIAHDVDGPAGPAHDDPATLPANLITLSATITDGDGDSVSGTANIGAAIVFRDHGPNVTDVDLYPLATATVDKSVGADASDPNANDEATVVLPPALLALGTPIGASANYIGGIAYVRSSRARRCCHAPNRLDP